MSQPYGAPQQQPGPAQPAVGVNLNLILPLVAAGLALIAFLLAFADDVPSSGFIEFMYAAGILAGLSVLPKAPRGLLYAAVPLAVIPMLVLLQSIVKTEADVEGMQVVLLIVSLLLAAAVVASLLLDAGVLKLTPKPANPYGQQPGGWNPQSGAFPQQGQPQQYGPPSGQFQQQQPVQPQQGQQPGQPQPTSYMPQPGQFGQPGQQPGQGTPPGGFGGPQQQS
ncbi:DUF5336 domain-containing protein [Saccharothrix yanglingensis]|uniref:Uncharacterized protein n=1 Tax=Saccharothrix yanglingensis TaxID=659496 RepID=A0ABU0WSE8_9PSEU|nr:DUF5336 domain-containing protein [Saccharothrix yanglingensis]MDQ2582453.1 hypothetical protein [Saccharothrix yanglingensis]